MQVSNIIPPVPGDLADWSDVSELQARMIEAMRAMSNLGTEVGVARQILSYESDRRKRALARAMSAPLAGGEPVSKRGNQTPVNPDTIAAINTGKFL